MLDSMSAKEYVDWEAYFSVVPFPETRAELRFAELLRATWMVGTHGKASKKLEDYVPNWWGDEHKQSPEQLAQNARIIAAQVKAARASKKKGT